MFTFPVGFEGLVLVSEDSKLGVNLPYTNGIYSVEIPQNGRLSVKSLKVFARWHKERARFKDGEAIPDILSTNNAAKTLFGLPYVRGKGCYYFIGTKEEYEFVSKRDDYEKLPLATKIAPNLA
jgi:hypothetical protein